jgi:hypothetical protein
MAVEISGPPIEKFVEAVNKRWQTTWLSYFDASIKKFGIEYAVSELLLALEDSRRSLDSKSVNFYRCVFQAGIDLIPHMPLATAEATVAQMIKLSGNDYQGLCGTASKALQERKECEANRQTAARTDAQTDAKMSLAGVIAHNQSFLTNPNHYITGYFP